MKFQIRLIFLVMLLAGLSVQAGDLRINIFNGSKGEPGTAERISIMDLSQGMVEIGAQTNVTGSATFSDLSPDAQKQYLIRATVDGANYSTTFSPDASVSAWQTEITVYDTESELRQVSASVPYFVIYAFVDHIYLQKRYILENRSQPPVTFHKSPGIVSVHVPENITELDYLTFKNGSMPLKTQAITVEGGQVLPNALRPGTTEIDIAYTLPYDPAGTIVTEEIGYDIGHFHVYTMPMNLSVVETGLTREGSDQENGLAIWAMENVVKGRSLSFSVSGPGMTEEAAQQGQQEQSSGRILVEHRLPMGNKLVLAGVLAFLIMFALFFSISQQQTDLKEDSINQLKQQKMNLLKRYASLLSNEDDPERDKVLTQLISVYKTLERIK